MSHDSLEKDTLYVLIKKTLTSALKVEPLYAHENTAGAVQLIPVTFTGNQTEPFSEQVSAGDFLAIFHRDRVTRIGVVEYMGDVAEHTEICQGKIGDL